MTKGQAAMSILRQYFGEKVDPGQALALMMAKIRTQEDLLVRLKDLCCGMAFDHGVLEGVLSTYDVSSEVEIDSLLALPRPELVERANPTGPPAQPPSRIIT